MPKRAAAASDGHAGLSPLRLRPAAASHGDGRRPALVPGEDAASVSTNSGTSATTRESRPTRRTSATAESSSPGARESGVAARGARLRPASELFGRGCAASSTAPTAVVRRVLTRFDVDEVASFLGLVTEVGALRASRTKRGVSWCDVGLWRRAAPHHVSARVWSPAAHRAFASVARGSLVRLLRREQDVVGDCAAGGMAASVDNDPFTMEVLDRDLATRIHMLEWATREGVVFPPPSDGAAAASVVPLHVALCADAAESAPLARRCDLLVRVEELVPVSVYDDDDACVERGSDCGRTAGLTARRAGSKPAGGTSFARCT